MVKLYTPLSLGVWIIALFMPFVGLAAAASLANIGKFPRWFAKFGEGVLGKIVAIGCIVTGATAAELERLPGVGPALARRIIAHRDSVGAFDSVDQLDRVRGIGPALLAKLRPLVKTGS